MPTQIRGHTPNKILFPEPHTSQHSNKIAVYPYEPQGTKGAQTYEQRKEKNYKTSG
jgi:hypothetical protein